MPLRSTVRKLSSNFAIDTPIFSANAGLAISAVMAAAYRIFLISSLSSTGGVRWHPVFPEAPLLSGESCGRGARVLRVLMARLGRGDAIANEITNSVLDRK